MLTIATFFWEHSPTGFQLPSMKSGLRYTHEHVYRLQAALQRHAGPHRFVCVSDQDIPGVECIPLWPDLADLGGCYRRLKVFDPRMRDLLGPRFMLVDLDVVICGDIRPLMDRPEPFVINKYRPTRRLDPEQHYNGGLMLMDAGARPQVWTKFNRYRSPRMIRANRRQCIGTDQAWIRLVLGKGEATFTEADGVYEYRQIKETLPENARLVLFAGARDPSLSQDVEWVRRNW